MLFPNKADPNAIYRLQRDSIAEPEGITSSAIDSANLGFNDVTEALEIGSLKAVELLPKGMVDTSFPDSLKASIKDLEEKKRYLEADIALTPNSALKSSADFIAGSVGGLANPLALLFMAFIIIAIRKLKAKRKGVLKKHGIST